MTSSTTLAKVVGVERVVVVEELHRLSDARLQDELSSDMYSEHGLDAVIRPVSGLVCQSLMVSSYWMPGSAHSHAATAILRHSSRASTVSMTSPVRAGPQAELGALLDRAHELVGDPDRVVGVLVLHGGDVLAAEVHVEAGVAQRADLVLLARLGLDELLDVGVVDVEHDHLGRAPGRAAGLDGAGGRVGAAHERDRAGRGAAGGQQLLGRPDPGEVEAGAGAALEDQALLAVPVEDRVHRVVDGEDEAGRDLLRARRADVEPDRGVEREHLVQQRPGQLVLEDLGVVGGREVAVLLAGPAVGRARPGR